MDNLWAAWRSDFILGDKEDICIFCEEGRRLKKQQRLILYEGETSFVIINLYPYNPGHLMVVPYRHLHDVEKLTDEENREMNDLIIETIRILKRRFKPHGFNIGMNLGAIGGAGIEYHLHWHVVPRYTGDINFLAAIGKTKLHSVGLDIIYEELKPEYDQYAGRTKRVKSK